MECWEPSQHLLIDTGKPRKTCVEVAGRRTFRNFRHKASSPNGRDTLPVPYSRIKKSNLFLAPADGTARLSRNVGMKLSLYAALNFKVDKVCAVRSYYAAYSGNFLPTFGDNLSVPSSRVKKSNKKTWISSSAKNRVFLEFLVGGFLLP